MKMTFDEWLEFARDVGRPPDVPVDAETMYREPESRLERACRLTKEELDAVMAEYNAWPYGSDSTHAEADSTPDAINPDHYKVGGIETIDYMRAKSTPEEFEGYLRLSALKYLSRAGHKDDALQDYKKAHWFMSRLIEELEK
jgi:hypothetical protein